MTKWYQNNVLFLENWHLYMHKKLFFSKCGFFLGDMGKQLFSKVVLKKRPMTIWQSDLKTTSFFSKCWNSRTYGQKTNFSKCSQNNVVFLEMLIYPKCGHIFAEIGKKQLFQIYKNVRFLIILICSAICAKNEFFKVISK